MRNKPSKDTIGRMRVQGTPFFRAVIPQEGNLRGHDISFYVREDGGILAIPSIVLGSDIKRLGYNKNKYIFKVKGRPLAAVAYNSIIKRIKTDSGFQVVFYRKFPARDKDKKILIFNELEYKLFKVAKDQAVKNAPGYFKELADKMRANA